MDRLTLSGMVFHAFHGVHPEEAKLGQRFEVDLDLHLSIEKPGQSDQLDDTVNYGAVYGVVRDVVQNRRYQLVEALATAIAAEVLRAFPLLEAVTVRLRKPQAPIRGVLSGVELEICRRRSWLEMLPK